MSSSRTRKKPPAARPGAPTTPAPGTKMAWMVIAVVLAIAAAGIWWWRRPAPFVLAQDANRNVLLVTIDTLRSDALGVDGGPADTPNLDRLANAGARFTFAHAHAVVTLVSHTTILTGVFPYEHGIRDNGGFRVKDGAATLGTRMHALGFATGAFIGGFPLTKRFGLAPGFDVYDDQMPALKPGSAEPERRADVVVARARDWIGGQKNKFFAWVHCFDPHSPYQPPEPFKTKFSAQPYYGEVSFVDQSLGPLLDELAGLDRPTLVIVTADHGESLGEHGELTHGMFAYEATLHIPLIVAEVRPHGAPAAGGVVIGTPVRHIDIVPTVLDAIGAPADPALPGSSLREVIRHRGGADRPGYFESMTYNLVRGWAPLRGVLVDRNKYIDLPIAELYDLAADPKEARNLASGQPDRVNVLLHTLGAYNVSPPDRPGQESADTRAQLSALGYVSGSAPAKKHYTEADDPKTLVGLDNDLHTADKLSHGGRTDDAVVLLNSVIARRPDTSDAYVALAYAYWESGRVAEAIATLERALKAGAPDRDVRIRLGIYLAESHTDAARAIQVLEGLPVSDVEALNALSIAYGDAGKFDRARETITKLLALDPTNGVAYYNLASITLREAQASKSAAKEQDAERFARRALELDPSLAGAYTTLGVILADTGRKADAIEAFKRAVDLDGTEFNALYNLWAELAAAGRRAEAVAYGKQFLATAPPGLVAPSDIADIRKYIGGH